MKKPKKNKNTEKRTNVTNISRSDYLVELGQSLMTGKMIAAKERWSTPRDHTVVAKVRARNLEIKVLEKKYNKLFKEKKGVSKSDSRPRDLNFLPDTHYSFLNIPRT